MLPVLGGTRKSGSWATRYAAPTLIHHYVSIHNYHPPQPFLDALMRVPDLRWEVARNRDLCLSCGSSMWRTRINKSLGRVVAGKPEPVLAVAFECDTCGTSYSRSWPDENPLPAPAVQSTEFHKVYGRSVRLRKDDGLESVHRRPSGGG